MSHPVDAPDPIAFGRDLAARKAWVFHASTMALGPVEHFFSGQGGDAYVSDVNNAEVPGPVLLLATGHALVCVPALFIELAEREVDFAKLGQEQLTTLMVKLFGTAVESKMEIRTAKLLAIALLRAQLHALEAGEAQPDEALG